jgi:UDPglucose--hexose-1-phosphate uridylyltransferase
MGLAVLPARLAEEISLMEDAILNGKSLRDDPKLASHADWCEELIGRHPELSKDNVRAILEAEIGEVFLKVLTDAGVFKRDEKGREAFLRFIDSI